MQAESMKFDVVIVGAGPAGLAAGIRYAQLCHAQKKTPSICILEKGSTIGAHILSGAVFEPQALHELIPDWQTKGAPVLTPVTQEKFLFLTKNNAFHLPTPPPMKNHGNYIISLGALSRWLAEQAEQLGVDIYPGFAATQLLFDEANNVIGVATGDLGKNKQDEPKRNFQPGMRILAKQTIFAEGCRGSLSQELMHHYHLRKDCQPQTYWIGLKELWEISPKHHSKGLVMHSMGWPLASNTYGGSFIYHLDNNQIFCGFVVGLDYQNPYLDPYEEFQRFKTHPTLRPLFEGGRCLEYGSRALNEGGFQSIPHLSFPGGLLIGGSAGFMNVPKIKGIHTAMKSGILAAQTLIQNEQNQEAPYQLKEFDSIIQKSAITQELYTVRNIRPAFKWGLFGGMLYGALDTYIFRGRAPWTLKYHPDHLSLKRANECQKIDYPKPDGKITFDKMTATSRSNVFHEEDQPCHLKLKDPDIAISINYALYAAPETRYCPAGVYEIVKNEKGEPSLQINATNCIHCKTCDIKDPKQNITWVPPEGGGGPNYSNM